MQCNAMKRMKRKEKVPPDAMHKTGVRLSVYVFPLNPVKQIPELLRAVRIEHVEVSNSAD
jgi:hypothetical protein